MINRRAFLASCAAALAAPARRPNIVVIHLDVWITELDVRGDSK